MQLVIADQAHAANAEPCFAERRFRGFDQRMPVEPDHALALATADQDLEALHRHIEIECLNPFDGDAQGVMVPEVIELGTVFALDRFDSQTLATAIGLGTISSGTNERCEARER